MAKKEKDCTLACRRNKVGGQAVLEGVMMKAGERCCLAVRTEDGKIKMKEDKFVSVRKKHKILGLPIVRGVVNFVEMMILSFRTLTASAEALGIEDEIEETKAEKWLKKHFGKGLFDVVMMFGMVLGVALALALFMFLPAFVTKLIDGAFPNGIGWARNLIEGGIKIGIFILYVWGVSFMKEIRRTYEYHGAEHKSIACFESGMELTPENAKKCTRLHPRCGTSFLFVMLLLSIVVFSFITWSNTLLRAGIKLLLMPVVMGLGYEFIMLAGKHDNILVKILSFPGLMMQKITTREPDEAQLEVAITALKAALPEEFPDFDIAAYESIDAKKAEETPAGAESAPEQE